MAGPSTIPHSATLLLFVPTWICSSGSAFLPSSTYAAKIPLCRAPGQQQRERFLLRGLPASPMPHTLHPCVDEPPQSVATWSALCCASVAALVPSTSTIRSTRGAIVAHRNGKCLVAFSSPRCVLTGLARSYESVPTRAQSVFDLNGRTTKKTELRPQNFETTFRRHYGNLHVAHT